MIPTGTVLIGAVGAAGRSRANTQLIGHTMDELIEWFAERLSQAENNRDESAATAPNSYGAGYDLGLYEGLKEAMAKVCEPRS